MMNEGAQRIRHAGEELLLLPERALLWPARDALLLSDVHFGKSATFRACGIPVPEGECHADLTRITALVRWHGVARVLVIGDFYHSGVPLTDALQDLLANFTATLGAEILLVRGNHDSARHAHLPMVERLCLPPIDLVHDPAAAAPQQATIAGHLHPLCRIARGGRGSRLPCFLRTDSLLVLPAFGSFTSGHLVEPSACQTLYPIAQGKVWQLPGSQAGPP